MRKVTLPLILTSMASLRLCIRRVCLSTFRLECFGADCLAASGKGTGDWTEAYSKAAAMVAKMTLEEKVAMARVP